MSVIEEIPPAHEQAFLGGLLRDSTAWEQLPALVDPRDFGDWRCRLIYENMLDVYRFGMKVDEHSTRKRLIDTGTFESIGGGPFVFSCFDRVPNGHDVAVNAKRITEAGRMRRLGLAHRTEAEKLDRGEYGSSDEAIEAAADIPKLFESQDAVDESITSAELDDGDFRTDYLVKGILARDQFCLVGGPSKGCKTTTLIDLGLSLGSGDPFFGEFEVPHPVRVAIVSGESGKRVIQETARRIARSKAWWNLRDYQNVVWRFDIPRLDQPGAIAKLIRFVRSNSLDVLILDPFYLMAGLNSSEAGNMFAVGPLLAELQRVGNETGVTVVIAHHFKKLGFAEQYSPPELGFIAWSGFEQYARQWLLLNRREAFDSEIGLHKLWFASGGSAGHGGLYALDALEGRLTDDGGRRWEVTITRASEARQQARQEREERKQDEDQQKLEIDAQAVKKELGKNSDGLTKSRLRDVTGINGPRIAKILAHLLGVEEIETADITSKNGQSYSGFKLVTRTPEQPLGQSVLLNRPTDTSTSLGQPPPFRGGVRPSGEVPVVGISHSDESELSECGHDQAANLFNGRATA